MNGLPTSELLFTGSIVNGHGWHVELIVPGRGQLPQAPGDWPERLYPGSLNVCVSPVGYPAEFTAKGLDKTVRCLDQGVFGPAFEIERDQFGNNQLRAADDCPRRGDAQVWRAVLCVAREKIECWVLRRIGSGLRDQLEMVSGVNIRGSFDLPREQEWPARVVMYGQWLAP